MATPRAAFTTSEGRAWKAWRPFLSTERIEWWMAKHANWPPKDATPPMAIEPYGKQLFLYAARRDVQAHRDPRAPSITQFSRPEWVHDDVQKEMKVWWKKKMTKEEADLSENMVAPMLCITDYRKRVLGYLSEREWNDFVKLIPKLKKTLALCRNKHAPPTEDVDQIEEDKRLYTYERHRYPKIASAKSQDRTSIGGFYSAHPSGEFQRWLRRKNRQTQIWGESKLRPLINRRLGQIVKEDPERSKDTQRWGGREEKEFESSRTARV